MQDQSVERLFEEQLDYYSRQDQSARISPIILYFLNWAKKKKKTNRLKIAEFGGAAGQLLFQIGKSYPKSELTNVEIISGYRSRQISKKIKFVHGSILDSKIDDQAFDCLIIRDVLHHLIGKNYRQTQINQKKALEELWRLTRPGGVIFIEELVNNSSLASRLIYFLSWANAKIGIRAKPFQITPNTVLAFLTSKKLIGLGQEIFGKKSIKKIKFEKSHYQWQLRLAHLGAESGKMFLLVEKTKR